MTNVLSRNWLVCYRFRSFHAVDNQLKRRLTAKAVTKTNVVSNLAKNFNKVSLTKFPLTDVPDVDLSKFKKIEKAYNLCKAENLDKAPNYYPSVTTILNQTMPPESLEVLKRWEAEKIKKLGIEGFNKYRKELFTRGKLLHSNIQKYLETKDESELKFTSKHQENMWKSIEHVLPKVSTIYASELPVHHSILKYRGILDCIATYENVPTILEWKTSEKIKPTVAHTYDNPLQAIAYFGCLQCDNLVQHIPDVKEVILVIAYEDGTKAHVHLLEHSFRVTLWKKFLKRLEQYWALKAAAA